MQLTLAISSKELWGAIPPLSDAPSKNPPTCETSGGSRGRLAKQIEAEVVVDVSLAFKDVTIAIVKVAHLGF